MLPLLCRIDTALSFALPWAAVVASAISIAPFTESGPQSAGLGPFVAIVLTFPGVLAPNAILAGVLAWFQPACRVPVARVLRIIVGLVAGSGLVGWLLRG